MLTSEDETIARIARDTATRKRKVSKLSYHLNDIVLLAELQQIAYSLQLMCKCCLELPQSSQWEIIAWVKIFNSSVFTDCFFKLKSCLRSVPCT